MARILTTLALMALALMTFFAGSASGQYFPPVPLLRLNDSDLTEPHGM